MKVMGDSVQLSIHVPPDRSKLKIHEDYIWICGDRPVPNWWWRMWYWALLGWKWESLQEEGKR